MAVVEIKKEEHDKNTFFQFKNPLYNYKKHFWAKKSWK